jgi:hypothetical protein
MGLFFHWMMLWDFVIWSVLSLDDNAMGLCKWVCSFIG